MRVADKHITAFRSLAQRDWPEVERHLEQLTEDDDVLGYHALIGMALRELVVGRFGKDRSVYDIVEYVAEARKRYRLGPTELDPRAAEHFIRCTLTGTNVLAESEYEPQQVSLAGAVVMDVLLEDADLDEQGLTEFIQNIRQRVATMQLPDDASATLEAARRLADPRRTGAGSSSSASWPRPSR